MTYGLWLSAGGMQVNEYRQSLAANNMANIDTAGFKRDLAVIHARRVEAAARGAERPFSPRYYDTLAGGTWVRPTFTNFETAGFENTGRQLDAAIDGDGFFSVSNGDDTFFTRDGRFTINANGDLKLVTGDGQFSVLDDAGAPIRIANPQAGPIEIMEDGTITQSAAPLARLGVVAFDDPQALDKRGAGTFAWLGESEPQVSNAPVRGGYLELSNVSPADSLASMIEISKAYELNARMVSLQDETLGQAINRVGRIG